MLWILDAGHGIETPGKRSPGWDSKTQTMAPPGVLEYEFNRDIVGRVAEALESMDIPVHIICQDEKTKPLKERVAIAKTMVEAWEGNAGMISVHSNAAGPGGWYEKARGVRPFTRRFPKPPSRKLAELLGKHISTRSGLRELPQRDHILRRDKETGEIKKVALGVLKVPCPAVLTENGFMTSRGDCQILHAENGRRSIAEGHVQAILDFQEWLNHP
jgi:N-acetylmuramoyl-L-alanine amidase